MGATAQTPYRPVQSKVTGGVNPMAPATVTQTRYNPATKTYQPFDVQRQTFAKPATYPQNPFQTTQAVQQMNQQRQAAVAAQQKAEARAKELEDQLKAIQDAEAKAAKDADVGFRTPFRTVSTAGSMGANLRIGDAGSRSRRAIRARSRGVSQLSTG